MFCALGGYNYLECVNLHLKNMLWNSWTEYWRVLLINTEVMSPNIPRTNAAFHWKSIFQSYFNGKWVNFTSNHSSWFNRWGLLKKRQEESAASSCSQQFNWVEVIMVTTSLLWQNISKHKHCIKQTGTERLKVIVHCCDVPFCFLSVLVDLALVSDLELRLGWP